MAPVPHVEGCSLPHSGQEFAQSIFERFSRKRSLPYTALVIERSRGRDLQRGVLSAVAEAAGVSRATVSKVVHRRSDVAESTRARVETLLDEHGFERYWEVPAPSVPRIVVVFRDLVGPYTLEVARGIVDAIALHGAESVVGTTNTRSVSDWLAHASAQHATGIIFVISMIVDADQDTIREHNLPVVLIDPLHEPAPDMPSIGVTNWNGARMAVTHLLDLGHRRIGMLAGRPHSPAGAARVHGYRAALDEAGIPHDPTLMRATDFDFEEGVRATESLLRGSEPPTAIFAASDAQALGVLEAARRLGCRVPDELSVVSFDDTSAASMASPPLTAVRQPYDEIGQVAARMLLDLSHHATLATNRVELATRLVVRDSSAPPPVAAVPPDGD